MPNRIAAVAVTGAVVLAALLVWLSWGGDPDGGLTPGQSEQGQSVGADGAQGGLAVATASSDLADGLEAQREAVNIGGPPTGVRGIVFDARTAQPLGGVEVIAIKDQPSLEPLVARFRGLFADGLMVETRAPRRELGRAITNPDGTFEITGLPGGRVFLDGRSDGWFVRTPGTARLAVGEIKEGIELMASPGGRVRGIVLGPDGAPSVGASVSLRPGLNAFLGQLTERQYRWLETVTDANGRFDMPGVPAGSGYTATAAAPNLALEEEHGIGVRAGQVTEVTLRSHLGGTIMGQVIDAAGTPVVSANVALVYLDISRMLMSADGRSEPLTTDEEGRFRIDHVSAGRVAFVAMAKDAAPSNIVELAVVDGGVYEDIILTTSEGAIVRGTVVDDQKQPVAGAAVEIRPFERSDDPQFIKMMLKIRRVQATTGADGTFVAKGLSGQRVMIQASKPGYTTALKFGVKLDDPDIVVEVQRGATIRGKVLAAGEPVTRFRVDTRTREVPKDETTDGESGATEAASQRNRRRDRRRGGVEFSIGGGGRRQMREGTRQLPEGQQMMDRGMDGSWREIQSDDGTFELRGIPPGRIRVRVRAEGYLNAEEQTIDLKPAQTSDLLAFEIAEGQPVSGIVLDGAGGAPVSDAQVTAYKQRDGGERGRGPFRANIDPEDFDFLGMASSRSQRSAMTDSRGVFDITALEPGNYRFTARHPDMAKSSTKDVEVVEGQPTPRVEIVLSTGGGIEGNVTGVGMKPLSDALMVAFSIQAGTMRSSTTDKGGYYRIDGLPPGQYIVFKSRMDERADNIGLELMSNMRLKTVTVKRDRFARLDVHDEGEDGVRIYGVVREGGAPVPRALVTMLGSDRDGLLGMGVRANAAGSDGRYELAGIKPGDYVMQVTRFRGQQVQTTFEIEVPDEVREFRFDIDLPTSSIVGRVIDSRGNPVKSMRVTLGSDEGALSGEGGLLGVIAQNGLSQDRTDDNGEFELKSVAPGKYRVTAGSRQGGGRSRRRGGESRGEAAVDGENKLVHGEASLAGLMVDGVTNVEGVLLTVPIAGKITGIVVDGSGQPVPAAEIAYKNTSEPKKKKRGNPMLDLLGASRAIRTDEEGRFEIAALNPGVYELRAEKSDAVEAGRKSDVRVHEDSETEITLNLVRGATLRLRATNADKNQIPIANISLLDGNGKAVISKVSTLSVLKRLMNAPDEVKDSGWYEFGSVPPDTYTVVVAEAGQPEIRITRTILDGETVEWDIDVQAELEARGRNKK